MLAEFVQEQGPIAWAIIRTAQLYETDFIIMGGYGFNPVKEVMLGCESDAVSREFKAKSSFGGVQASRSAYSIAIAVPPDWGKGHILRFR